MIPRRLRAWLVASLVVALAVSALAALYDSHGRNRIVEAEMRANTRVTPSLYATIWPPHGAALEALRSTPLNVLRADPVHARIDRSLETLLADQPSILQVSVITTNGRVLYSTDPAEIGRVQTESRIFLHARNRQPAGTLVTTGHAEGPTGHAEGPSGRVEVVSMIPVFLEPQSADQPDSRIPDLIFEVHSDVSDEYAGHLAHLVTLVVAAALILACVAGAFVLFGRRAAQQVYRAEVARQAQHDAV